MTRFRRRGFALLELIVALGILAVVTAGAAGVWYAILDRSEQVARSKRASETAAHAERMLRTAVANALPPNVTGFHASGTEFQLRSSCASPYGQAEECVVRVNADGSSLSIEWAASHDAGHLRLHSSRADIHIIYLANAAYGGDWRQEWSAARLPVAIGVVMAGDTLIAPFRIR